MLYERTSWVNVVQLEVHLAHFLKSGMLHPLLGLPASGEHSLACPAKPVGWPRLVQPSLHAFHKK